MTEALLYMCMYIHVKYQMFLSDFSETWIFLAYFR